MKFGLPIKTKGPDEGATFEEFIAMMEKGVEIIKKRGKSTTGEKTMLDTFVPAVETLRKEYQVLHLPQRFLKYSTRICLTNN